MTEASELSRDSLTIFRVRLISAISKFAVGKHDSRGPHYGTFAAGWREGKGRQAGRNTMQNARVPFYTWDLHGRSRRKENTVALSCSKLANLVTVARTGAPKRYF